MTDWRPKSRKVPLGLICLVWLTLGGATQVLASLPKPNLRPVLPLSQDGVVVAVWDLPPHLPSLEWLAQASPDEQFTKVASQSGWIKPKIGLFFLTAPQGQIFVRVGVRETGSREIVWSDISKSYQRDDRWASPDQVRTAFPEPKVVVTKPQVLPVIFIHGLGGRPTDWENSSENRDYLGFLLAKGYPRTFLRPYAYADYNFDGAYDADGDIRGVALNLLSEISQLRRLHRQTGGEGRVDIIAFSLGGLVGRTYLRSVAKDCGVGKFIDVASPHLGVKLLLPWANLVDQPLGPQLQQALANLVREWYARDNARPLDLESPAVKQLVPGSPFLNWLNEEPPCQEGSQYHLLYGDLHVKFSQQLFGLNLVSQEYTLGDLLIDPKSASTIPGVVPKLYPFKSSHQWQIKPTKLAGKWLYRFELDVPDLKYWHTQLIRHPQVKATIWEILNK